MMLSLNGSSNTTTLPVSGPSSQSTDTPIPTAKFIQGRVGMCKRYGKIIKKRYRYGMLVIKIDGGGTIIFYNNLDTIENGDDNSISMMEDESALKDYSNDGESPFLRKVRNRNRVTVFVEEFQEKLEKETYLHIPAVRRLYHCIGVVLSLIYITHISLLIVPNICYHIYQMCI